jgi:hypothetical protein
MEPLTRGKTWGLAAVVGCGACCGGLAGNAAWLASTVVLVGGLASAWVWGGAGLLLAGATVGILAVRRYRHGRPHAHGLSDESR